MLTAGKRRRARIVVAHHPGVCVVMHFIALSVVGAVRRDRGRCRPRHAGGDHRLRAARLVADDVAGDGAGHARVLCPLRPRPDPVVAGDSRNACSRCGSRRSRLSTMIMAVLLAAPFINVLVWRGGARWLAGYGVVLAVGATAAAMSVALTVALFRTIGPAANTAGGADRRRRDRRDLRDRVAGGGDRLLRHDPQFTFLQSDALVAVRAGGREPVWWPARAMLGDCTALRAVVGRRLYDTRRVNCYVFSARFGEHAVAAAGVSDGSIGHRRRLHAFRAASPKQILRRKEWTLLIRDPWLASQTLMQLLYLLPPALMLWQAFGRGVDDLVLLVPVLVMAAGQLAGGLAWLAISGEDAPDLVRPHRSPRTGSYAPSSRRSSAASPCSSRRSCWRWRSPRRATPWPRRYWRRGAVLDADPALVSHPGAAQALPPPPDVFARRHLRRGVLLDRVGRDRGPCRVRPMASGDHRRDRARHPGRGASDQPSQDHLDPLKGRPARRYPGGSSKSARGKAGRTRRPQLLCARS